MPPAQLTCVSCNSPFPLNRELASIPDASTVAFDAGRGRVWRICGKCGEWNLLGAEASAAALPEVQARFGAAGGGVGGGATATAMVSSRLSILRVGQGAVAAYDGNALRRRKKWTERWRNFGVVYLTASIAVVVAIAVWLLRGPVPMGIASEFALLAPLSLLAGWLREYRLKKPVKKSHLVVWVVLSVAGMLFNRSLGAESFMYPLLPWLAVPFALSIAIPPTAVSTFETSDGEQIKFMTGDELRAPSLAWDEHGKHLTLHDLPKGVVVAGDDARTMLKKLLVYASGIRLSMSTQRQIDTAYELLRTAGGLPGVLRALEGYRRDSDGRIVLRGLPRVYLLALDFGLAAEMAAPHELTELSERVAQAQLVAGEAEALANEQVE